MPKRSNAFQRAAFVIHRSLEPEWKVTESDMLLDIHTGTSREVDITARRTAAGHELLLCVECRDHGRAADVSWVEQMFTKHQSLPTSKLALWSRSGFTREAIAKSKLLKIDAISQTVRAQPTWSKMADRLCAGFLQYVTPTFSPFVDVKLPTGQLQRYEDVASWVFLDQGGDVVGSIQALLQELQRNELVRSTILDHAPPGNGDFWSELVPPVEWFVDVPTHGRCAINRIGVGMHTFGEKSPTTAITVHQPDRALTLVSAELHAGTFELHVEEVPNGAHTVRAMVLPPDA
jgi:hypothetical protein